MVINDRLLPIEQDTKTLLVIEVKKQDGTGNSYTVAAAAQSNESESLKAIIKGAMKGISKGGTLPFQLESYMAAHERYAKATSEDPEIKVVVSACKNGKVRIPRGHDSMQVGDTVVIVTTERGLRDLDDILA